LVAVQVVKVVVAELVTLELDRVAVFDAVEVLERLEVVRLAVVVSVADRVVLALRVDEVFVKLAVMVVVVRAAGVQLKP
jgi:hypothetical protein